MEKIFEALLELIPFAQLFEKLGMSTKVSLALAGLIVAIIAFILYSFLNIS